MSKFQFKKGDRVRYKQLNWGVGTVMADSLPGEYVDVLWPPNGSANDTEEGYRDMNRSSNLELVEEETLENNPTSPNEEMVAHPKHYGGDTTYEVIKVIEAWGLDNDAFLFNVIKYTARAGKKGKQLEDLKKAEFYLQRRIAILEASNA